MKALVRSLTASEGGFSLTELLLYIALLSAFTSTMGVSLFQVVTAQPDVVADGAATNELRRGLSVFATDVSNARDATLTSDVLTLSWTDYYEDAGTDHTAIYQRSGDLLMRNLDGASFPVARGVTVATFAIDGRSVSTFVQVNAATGTTRSLTMKAVMQAQAP